MLYKTVQYCTCCARDKPRVRVNCEGGLLQQTAEEINIYLKRCASTES